MKLKSQIMNEEDINRTLIRLAHQILEKNNGAENICIIGIQRRGIPLAQIIADNIEKIEEKKVVLEEKLVKEKEKEKEKMEADEEEEGEKEEEDEKEENINNKE